ncbi:hypothetical protein BOTCAL_0311g00080 [Botryotinia calthae]|uniref:Uncharacterized protein n=1 Tax=Botryotinia calthae TaxID=38488 RepID=A0A4Y8CUR3_9HELO|nr:hypothetical protein BOTCAL_0311g00080 [Botryotinia calthae]
MSEETSALSVLVELDEYNRRQIQIADSEFEPDVRSLMHKLCLSEWRLKFVETALEASNKLLVDSQRKVEILDQELSKLNSKALIIYAELQGAKAEIKSLKGEECSHLDEISILRSAKEEEELKTSGLKESVKKLRAEATERERTFRQEKLDTETKHRKELGKMTVNLEAATTKTEQASADVKKIKQNTSKAVGKCNTKLTKKTAELVEKERELSIATEALATKSSEFENTSKALSEIRESHSNCSKTIKSLETDLRDSKAINNASRTSVHAEADRIKKGIAKATVDIDARLNELEHSNQGLETKCRMFEDRYSEQVVASAKKEEQFIRSVVEERRSNDRVLGLQRDLEKEENRCFELELACQDLRHQFGLDKE